LAAEEANGQNTSAFTQLAVDLSRNMREKKVHVKKKKVEVEK